MISMAFQQPPCEVSWKGHLCHVQQITTATLPAAAVAKAGDMDTPAEGFAGMVSSATTQTAAFTTLKAG
jgi:hypothetical protein